MSPPNHKPDVDAPMAETSTSTSTSTSSSQKRKADLDEIEVDITLPEPPSKKARRALKKGKSVTTKSKNDRDISDLVDKDGEEGGGEEKNGKKARSEHGVWIGNMPFTVSSADIRKWLVDNSGGSISDEAITRVNVPVNKNAAPALAAGPGGERKGKANKGFAYVDFADVATKFAAIALSETELEGRKLLIKDSTSYEGRPEKPKEPVKSEDDDAAAAGGDDAQKNESRKIFVGNMGFQTSEDDLWHHFQKCGEIDWVKVATFEDSGKCKGYGWIKFADPAGAAWAVKGFVKIKETVDTEDDFVEGADTKDGSDGKDTEAKYKMRKWWVNKLKGRTLKIELAEDEQVRYKKRFGKDAKRDGQQPGAKPTPGGRKGRGEAPVKVEASAKIEAAA